MTKIRGGMTVTIDSSLDNLMKDLLSDMKGLFDINGEVEPLILDWMWVNTNYNNSMVIIEKGAKEEIAKKSNVKPQSVSDALTNLVKRGLIIRNRRMYYSFSSNFPKLMKCDKNSKFTIEVNYNLETSE